MRVLLIPVILAAMAAEAAPAFAESVETESVAEVLPELSAEHQQLLRCSAAFGIIAGEQKRGVESSNIWPPLIERGQEFFVRIGAQLMAEYKLDQPQIDALMWQQVEALQAESWNSDDPAAVVEGVMVPCLVTLEASGI